MEEERTSRTERERSECVICKVSMTLDQYVVGWGWCNECWGDAIDADHIVALIKGVPVNTGGPPSDKVRRVMNWLRHHHGLKREESYIEFGVGK